MNIREEELKKVLAKMQECRNLGQEQGHSSGDNLLLETIDVLAAPHFHAREVKGLAVKIKAAWEDLDKWYA